ncbi:MAG TPA: MFS transporter [Solirubrobacteraceae bacterium]|nr:MFS transporter [Solirubrobacteraceae bacterium]
MISLLGRPYPRRFFLAHLQSQLGTGAAYVALLLIAYQRLHQSWAIALVLLADVVPGIVLAAPFGALADRLPRARVVVAGQLVSAAAFLGLAFIASFPATVAFALLAGVGSTMLRPALGAALPELVAEDERSAATALYGMIFTVGMTAGPALTALVLLFSTPALVLAVNGVTFLVAAALIARLPLGGASREASGDGGQTLWEATRGGVAAARQAPGVMALLVIGAVSMFAAAVINIAEPILATGPLHAGRAGFAVLVGLYGCGMFSGSLLSGRGGTRVGQLRGLWLTGNALTAAGMIATAAAPNLAVAGATFAVTGVGNAFVCSFGMRLFQELTPSSVLGSVLGLRDTAANVGLLVAFVAGGLLVSPLGSRAVFAAGGVALFVVTFVAMLAFRPHEREALPDAEPRLRAVAPLEVEQAVAGAH